jgi:predicted RNA-binding protein with PIN domain
MTLVIDGYNLLHASGILGRGIGPGGLERSRLALLNFLAESLEEAQRSTTTVVFDAREAPPGLPRVIEHRGMTVRFAERGEDADHVIEQLIRADSAPRRLVVVSSDHRLHRAARRRRAKAVDSDVWYADVLRKRIEGARRTRRSAKPTEPPSAGEVRFWLRQFGLETPEAESLGDKMSPGAPTEQAAPGDPFPPGYAQDVREEDL